MIMTKEELKKRKINSIINSKEKLCVYCQKPLEGRRMFYCSGKCQDHGHYIIHKEKYIANARKWEKENPERAYDEKRKESLRAFRKRSPERFNELIKKDYQRNKYKWNSRNNTLKIIKGEQYKKTEVVLEKKCKFCNSIENLEIHHEIYPTKKKEIEQAMINGQIYYLCRKCHGGIHRHE